MKGVVLAGGLGTRLYPLTYATNKHLLPVYNLPMIFYPIKTLVNAGIKDVIVVTGGPHAGHFLRVLKNGKELGLSTLHFAYQENEGGIAEALSLTEEFVDSDNLCVILGDNCTDADISNEVQNFKTGAHLFLKEVTDPERFGVVSFNDNRITKITEKPTRPDSNYAVTGLYIYDAIVFEKIRQIKRSKRGELEITDVNNLYLGERNLSYSELQGYWRDAGNPEALLEVSNYWATKQERR